VPYIKLDFLNMRGRLETAYCCLGYKGGSECCCLATGDFLSFPVGPCGLKFQLESLDSRCEIGSYCIHVAWPLSVDSLTEQPSAERRYSADSVECHDDVIFSTSKFNEMLKTLLSQRPVWLFKYWNECKCSRSCLLKFSRYCVYQFSYSFTTG
jgi:hypothetical protein